MIENNFGWFWENIGQRVFLKWDFWFSWKWYWEALERFLV